MADKDNIAYAFPDDGACKRFHHFFGDDNPITCVKIRDGNKRIVKVKDGTVIINREHYMAISILHL